MASPFPGMDPYLEAPDIWPDFHDRLATEISSDLNTTLGEPGLRRRSLPPHDRLHPAPRSSIARRRSSVGGGTVARRRFALASTVPTNPKRFDNFAIRFWKCEIIELLQCHPPPAGTSQRPGLAGLVDAVKRVQCDAKVSVGVVD